MNKSDNFEWGKFEAAIDLLKSDISSLYFRDVIKAATGYQILPFNNHTFKSIKLIDVWLKNNLMTLSHKIYKNFTGRANELGNFVEAEILNALNNIPNVNCTKPLLSTGKKQASGYPDCLIENNNNKIYADIKTYQSKTSASTLRSFFYQPTNNNKIHFDAPHCIIAFETNSIGGDNKSPFQLVNYKIIDAYNLKVTFKAEFNTSNKLMYSLNNLSNSNA